MVVAADDGVMPQTLEHREVLRGLGVSSGVVAVSKSDIADPAPAAAQAAELFPHAAVIACSARTGAGVQQLRSALEALAAEIVSRAVSPGQARLHLDRVFSLAGHGTIVTGTLWSGAIAVGDELELLPRGTPVRVRAIQVHDVPQQRADAGQRVAVNLAGAKARDVARGDLLAGRQAVAETRVLDCALQLRDARSGERLQVHHGTRAVPGRIAGLEADLWQLRLERPLLALRGDRLVVRRLAPPETLGGGVVLDPSARRHGSRPDVLERLRRLRDGEDAPRGGPPQVPRNPTAQPRRPPSGPPVGRQALTTLERRLREAGTMLLSEAQLSEDVAALKALREQGRAVRLSGRLYAHADVLAPIRERVISLIESEGSLTLAGARDALGVSRKSAQAFLEHLDGARVTRRLPDDRRILAARARPQDRLR
jgi:selenocysteine-specific elongation factor